MAFYEHSSRSLIKTAVYRLLILVSSAIVGYLITHEYRTAAKFTLYTNIVSTVIYYAHERAWNHVHWGKRKTNKH